MKKLILLLLIAIGMSAQTQNTLLLSSASGHPGDTVTLTLSMSNSDAVTAMQTFIPLGNQLTYVAGSATLSSRSNGHQLTATVLNDTLRIYSYSFGLNSYSGNSGALVTFRVVLGNDPSTYSLPLTSTFLSSSSASSLPVQSSAGSVTIWAPKITLLPANSQAGTIAYQIDYGHCPIRSNYTRTVTVRNIGNEPLTLNSVTFDEGTLSCIISGITIAAGGQQQVTINYLPTASGTVTLHGFFHSNAKAGDSVLIINADPYSVNELRPLSVSGYTDSIVTVQLRMNNMDSIVAMQTSIKLPEALTYITGSFAVDSSRSQGHIASAGQIGDTLTMLLTSNDNRSLRGGDGVVVSFKIRLHGYGSYTLRLFQTVLVDATRQNVLSSVYTGSVNIYSPALSCSNTLDMGSTPVTDTVESVFAINNNGNAQLVIDHVQFMGMNASAQYFSVAESFPLTVGNHQSTTLHVRYSGLDAGTHNALMQIYNNDPRSMLHQVNVTCNRYEPNALYMSGNPDSSMDNATVSVILDNYSDITAVQMDVQYPHHYASLESGDIHITNRSNGHVVSAARLNDSTIRVLLLSLDNRTLNGNDGPILDLHLHLLDTNNLDSYPMQLHNVIVANASGRNMLTSLDSVAYIATRLLWDTLYIHDTTVVVETYYDTITMTDTIFRIDYVYDTLYLERDTLYVWLHDTTIVDHYDTIVVVQYDTTIVVQYDTITVDNYIFDTVYLHDTTDVYHFIHDTTIVVQHDTTTVHDTVIEPIIYHDLVVTTNNAAFGVGVGSGHFPEGSYVEIAAIPTPGNRFQQWDDGFADNPRTITLTQDMNYWAVFVPTSPNSIQEPQKATVHVEGESIVVTGLNGESVGILDVNGRRLKQIPNALGTVRFVVPVTGSYMVQIGNGQPTKVSVIR